MTYRFTFPSPDEWSRIVIRLHWDSLFKAGGNPDMLVVGAKMKKNIQELYANFD